MGMNSDFKILVGVFSLVGMLGMGTLFVFQNPVDLSFLDQQNPTDLLNTITDVCWPGATINYESFLCQDTFCEIQTKHALLKGDYEYLNLNGKEVYAFECSTGETKHYKVTTLDFQEVNHSNYFTTLGPLNVDKDAYFALVVMMHPDQLRTIIKNPDLIEATHSGNVAKNQYVTDKGIIEQSENCSIQMQNFEFSNYPYYKEYNNTFRVRRVYREGLNYFREEAVLNPEIQITSHLVEEIMGCE